MFFFPKDRYRTWNLDKNKDYPVKRCSNDAQCLQAHLADCEDSFSTCCHLPRNIMSRPF